MKNIERDSHLAYYGQLVQYIEAIFNDTQGLMSPLELLASHIVPFSSDSGSYFFILNSFNYVLIFFF